MLKKLIETLSVQDKRSLLYAFEHGFSLIVKAPNTEYFIGVNCAGCDYIIKEEANNWFLLAKGNV